MSSIDCCTGVRMKYIDEINVLWRFRKSTTSFGVKDSTGDRTSCVDLSHCERHDDNSAGINPLPERSHKKHYCRNKRRTQRGNVCIAVEQNSTKLNAIKSTDTDTSLVL